MKNHTLFISLLVTFISSTALPTVLHWPECSVGELSIQNKTTSEKKIWLQKFDPILKAELAIDLLPSEIQKLTITRKNTTVRNALLHFANPKDIDVVYRCVDKYFLVTSIEGGLQTFRKSDLPAQTVYLKNLYSAKNNFKIEILNRFRQPIQTLFATMNSNEQKKLTLPKNPDLTYVRISAVNKFSAFNLNSTGSQNPMIVDAQVVPQNPNGAYFEISPRTGTGDSFTVLINDSKMIASARLQISDPHLEKMLFAKIQKGHNNQNRNLASITKSFWNWSVTEVTNIADIGSTACNGLPQIVDDRIDSWITDPGRICFWTYRIKREVPAAEISTGQKIN